MSKVYHTTTHIPQEKSCKTCGISKLLSEFPKRKDAEDGRRGVCKKCRYAQTKKWRDNEGRKEKTAAYWKAWYAENKQKITAKSKEYRGTPGGKEQREKADARYSKKHPQRMRALWAVKDAKKAGKLRKQPCEVCGKTEHIHAHHADYSKPLEVEWLCPQHHKDRHRKPQTQ